MSYPSPNVFIDVEEDLPPLTEDDAAFVALATYDLLRRLEDEPL